MRRSIFLLCALLTAGTLGLLDACFTDASNCLTADSCDPSDASEGGSASGDAARPEAKSDAGDGATPDAGDGATPDAEGGSPGPANDAGDAGDGGEPDANAADAKPDGEGGGDGDVADAEDAG